MDFSQDRRARVPRENIVPMINVVFLLLIFFLMSAQITPQSPFDVTLPDAGLSETPEGSLTIFVSSQGTVYFDGFENEDALNALAMQPDARLKIEADRALEVEVFARLLRRLRASGFGEIELITDSADAAR